MPPIPIRRIPDYEWAYGNRYVVLAHISWASGDHWAVAAFEVEEGQDEVPLGPARYFASRDDAEACASRLRVTHGNAPVLEITLRLP